MMVNNFQINLINPSSIKVAIITFDFLIHQDPHVFSVKLMTSVDNPSTTIHTNFPESVIICCTNVKTIYSETSSSDIPFHTDTHVPKVIIHSS